MIILGSTIGYPGPLSFGAPGFIELAPAIFTTFFFGTPALADIPLP